MKSIFFVAGLLVQTQATPVKKALLSFTECDLVEIIVLELHNYQSATPFCSSFLHIATQTYTATSTISAFTTTTLTSVAPTSTITASTVTVYTTELDVSTTCIPQAFKYKREGHKISSTTKCADSKTTTSSKVAPTYTVPSCLTNFASAEISTACSCLAIPTPSTTMTIPFTVTPVVSATITTTPIMTFTPTSTITITSLVTTNICPTPTSCGNQGIEWAYFVDTAKNIDPHYSTFNETSFKTEMPLYTDTTYTIGGINSKASPISIYAANRTFPLNYFGLAHRGYIFAEVTGTYTFSLGHPDDISMLWVGPLAYSGWTRANANVINYLSNPNPTTSSVDLVEGVYYPIRILFGQGQGSAIFSASVTAPNGVVILSSSSKPSPYLVQYSCDGIAAPAYEPWGSET